MRGVGALEVMLLMDFKKIEESVLKITGYVSAKFFWICRC